MLLYTKFNSFPGSSWPLSLKDNSLLQRLMDFVKLKSGNSSSVMSEQLNKETLYLVIFPLIICIIFLICWTFGTSLAQYLRRYSVVKPSDNLRLSETRSSHQDTERSETLNTPLLLSRHS